MRKLVVVISVTLVLLSVTPQPVAADDTWPDSCRDAPVIEPGTHSGTLTPDDYDVFKVEGLSEGDFIHLTLRRPSGGPSMLIGKHRDQDSPFTSQDVSDWFEQLAGEEPVTEYTATFDAEPVAGFPMADHQIDDNGGKMSVKLYRQSGSGPVCVPLTTITQEGTDWSINFTTNDNTPPTVPSQERIAELESQVDELQQELERAESENSSSQGAVVINITVTPASDRQNFVTGGKAQVTVESDDVDPQDVVVEYGSATYDVPASGQVEIALADPGTHELDVVYEDIKQTKTFRVQESSGEDGQQSGNGPISTGSGPGFGFSAAIVAGILVACVAIYRDK